jgi:plastocyanin
VLLGLLAALAASGCGSSKSKSSPSAGPQTRTVQVDASSRAFNAAFLSYFPKVVTVHPGDTVAFHENWTGEPHSVTMGTLVEKGLAAAAHANPNGPPPAAFAALPVMLPQGPGDAVQAAARPCYVATGAPPRKPAVPCPKVAQPAFGGTQAYYSSGFLQPKQTWQVHVADNIKPGTYRYYCNLHGADMSGTIVVVPRSQPIPSQSTVDAQGRAELQAQVRKTQPAYLAAKAGHYPLPGNLAGVASQQAQQVEVNEFLPATIRAKVGQPVNWTFVGIHTATVGGPEDVPPLLKVAPDGGVHLRQDLLAPAGGPGAPGPSGQPPTGKPKPITVNGGTYAGTGRHSSGLVLSFPPQFVRYGVRITKPGTYTFDCVIHPHMEAKVVVTR